MFKQQTLFKRFISLCLFTMILLLGGCGQTGALYLPPHPPASPAKTPIAAKYLHKPNQDRYHHTIDN